MWLCFNCVGYFYWNSTQNGCYGNFSCSSRELAYFPSFKIIVHFVLSQIADLVAWSTSILVFSSLHIFGFTLFIEHTLAHLCVDWRLMLWCSAIGGCVFAPNGMGYFLCSASEIERFSLSARFPSFVYCSVEFSEIRDANAVSVNNSASQEAANGHDASNVDNNTSRNAEEIREGVQ